MRIRTATGPLVASWLVLFATSAAANEIAQRKVAMDDVGEAMKVIAAIFKNEQPFKGEDVAKAGYTILNNLTAAGTLFPEGSTGENSRAKPEIWQDMDRFTGDLDKAKAAARQVAETGTANDEAGFRRVFLGLGTGCTSCHEAFRRPRDGS